MSAPESACGSLIKGYRIQGHLLKGVGWVIEKIHLKEKQVGECLTSPVFYALDEKCQMKIFPRGLDEECEDHVSFFLQPLNGSTDIENPFMLFVSTDVDSTYEYDSIIYSNDRATDNMYGIRKYFKYDELIRRVNQSSADTIVFGFGVYLDNVHYHPHDFSDVLNNQSYSDVRFIVEGKSIHAHKVILANKSDVFAAMFEHNMKENLEGVVEIKDIKYDIILALFGYIYSGAIGDMETIAMPLLIAADKYKVIDLTAICSEYLVSHLNIENVKECLDLAECHNVHSLKLKSIDFIKSNLNEISHKSDTLKLIMESYPDIMVEVIRDLSEKAMIATS